MVYFSPGNEVDVLYFPAGRQVTMPGTPVSENILTEDYMVLSYHKNTYLLYLQLLIAFCSVPPLRFNTT